MEEEYEAIIAEQYNKLQEQNQESKYIRDMEIERLSRQLEEQSEKIKQLEDENKDYKIKYLALMIGQFPDTTETYKKYKKELNELLNKGGVAMLKEQSYTDKAKSIYICDMCKKEIDVYENNKLSVQKQGKSKKVKDLCDRCYDIVIRSIENYAKKHKKEE